jgi:hypothetical protein
MVLKENLPGRDKAEALKKELSRMEGERREMEAGWDTAQRFVSSVVLRFNAGDDDGGPGKSYETPKRVTSDPANFLETLISGICGYSVNENILWLKLGLRDKKLESRYGVKDWLEDAEGALYAEFNRGNFYSQIPLLVENAALFGHGVMLIDENIEDNKIRFSAMDAREIYLDTNEYDETDTVFRKFSMTAEGAVSYFGYEKMSGEVKALWDNKEGGKRLAILHAVWRDKSSKGKALKGGFAYSSVFVDLRHGHIIKESGYDTFPYAVFIWKKTSGNKYGIGPALMAVNDIKLLHLAEESRAEIAEMSAHPPLMVPKHLTGAEGLLPGGRYYYQEGLPIKPIEVGSNYPITLEVTREYIERVKAWFHVDFFLMLQRQPRQMTATEVLELQGEKAAVLSVMINNLNSALQKIVHRSVDILFRQRKMPPLPQVLEENRAGLKADFIGVLAQAQKKAHQTSGIMQGIQIIGAMAQMARGIPQAAAAFDFVDFQEFLKRGLESAGLSQKIIREDDEVEEERRARAEAEAAMAAMQQQAMATQNYGKPDGPVNNGPPLAAMTEG